MDSQQKLRIMLRPLFADYEQEMVPASESEINTFTKRACDEDVPRDVVEELVAFYGVTNGIPCLDGFDFHRCDDILIFEWWDHRELWLAQRDFYTLRWAHNRFCLGDAGNVSFSKDDEYTALTSLIEGAITQWYGPSGV
jgi:hypothetical protein